MNEAETRVEHIDPALALQAENRRLQKELHRMAQQRDILKKTLGIISAPSDNGLNG